MNAMKWYGELPFSWIDLKDVYHKEPNKVVISSWTALDFYGINEDLISETYITVPKGYNPVKIREFAKVKQRSGERYDFQIEQYNIEDKIVNIYSPERAVVEVVKEQKGKYTDLIISFIKNFFRKFKYNVPKLIEAAKKFNILNEILNLRKLSE